MKQLATTAFVIVTSTLMIQNVWYPETFSSFKKTWRAGVGAIIFLMGFAVARALFDIYGEQVRKIKAGTYDSSGDYPDAGFDEASSEKTAGVTSGTAGPETTDETSGAIESDSMQP